MPRPRAPARQRGKPRSGGSPSGNPSSSRPERLTFAAAPVFRQSDGIPAVSGTAGTRTSRGEPRPRGLVRAEVMAAATIFEERRLEQAGAPIETGHHRAERDLQDVGHLAVGEIL